MVDWGKKIIEGERRRTSQGGVPIYNPTIAKVKVHYDIFVDSYEKQRALQALTNRSLEELSSMRARADELILDIGTKWKKSSRMYFLTKPAWINVVIMDSFIIIGREKNNRNKLD